MDIQLALKESYIKPAKDLRISEDQQEDFKKGLTFEKVPELFTRGHHLVETRLSLLEERAEFSQYIVLPTKFSFPKVVRITSLAIGFVSKTRKGKRTLGLLLAVYLKLTFLQLKIVAVILESKLV